MPTRTYTTFWTRAGGAALLLLSSGLTAGPAQADRAVVIGINEYPKLAQGSNLEGCVNDAKGIARTLTAQGFEVVSLTNEEASRSGIMETLARMKTMTGPDERFVFYFAGHGTVATDGASTLMPGDASEKDEHSDIGRDELYHAILAIPARSRTALLDACFSGGLSRKGIGRRVKKTRAYRRGGLAEAPLRRDIESGTDSNDHIAGGTEIVYFTASLANQTSGEDDFEGARGGVFTHFLTARLQKATAQTLWNEVQKDVTGEVADYMDQTQTPKLSPAEYSGRQVFGERGAPKAEPKPVVKTEPIPVVKTEPKPVVKTEPKTEPIPVVKAEPRRTIWDDFNEDRTEASQFSLMMTPGKSALKIGEKFHFEVKSAQSGWLVLLEKDTDGKVYLLTPKGGNLDKGRISADSMLRLPMDAGREYSADARGIERVKAILFTSEENALALVKAFPADGAEPRKLRRILETESLRQSFYTFGLTFEVE
jgi:uncharacterized caspase-like protein